jgi:hypothetical protein
VWNRVFCESTSSRGSESTSSRGSMQVDEVKAHQAEDVKARQVEEGMNAKIDGKRIGCLVGACRQQRLVLRLET